MVFQIVLCQYSGELDVIVGIPVAGRNSVELEEVIGLLANLVVVRTDLSGDPAVPELLREVRSAIINALTNQDVPFERLVKAVHPSRSLAQNPIFQVLFGSVKAAAQWKRFVDLTASPYIVQASTVPFDLSLSSIEESVDRWWICADYRTELFTYNQIECLLDHYVGLLRSVVERPEVRLSQLGAPTGWPTTKGARNRVAVSEAGTTSLAPNGLPAGIRQPLPTPRVRRHSSDIVEEALADLWAKVLGTRPPAVSSNFFDIGGYSLLAVNLMFRRIQRVQEGVKFCEDGVCRLGPDERFRALALDGVEEANEFAVAMALHAAADDGAVEHAERGEQGGRGVPLSRACAGTRRYEQTEIVL